MQKQQNPYQFLNTFCIRTPLFSLNFYKNLFNKKDIGLDELKKIWKEDTIKEAIFLASPELYKQLDHYFKTRKDGHVIKNEKLEQTFLKYLIRLSSRCTPFGLFAGVSTGSFNSATKIELKPIKDYLRITKYDTNYLSLLLDHLSKNSIIKMQLLFYPNSTLYLVANQYRFIEYQINDKIRSYSVEAVECTPYLSQLLSEAKKGMTIEDLSRVLLDNNDVSIEEANDFIETLIENQILVSEFELTVTGKDILANAIERIGELKNTKKISINFQSLQDYLKAIDKKVGNTVEPYLKNFEMLNEIKIPFEEKYVFQVDLFSKTNTNELNVKHGHKLKRLLPLLNKLTPYKPKTNLEQFKNAFYNRYESREILLAQVLDIESGIGYIQNNTISDTTPFLQDIIPEKRLSSEQNIEWNDVDNILYKKLIANKDNYTIELTDNDFDYLESNWDNTPDTLSAFIEIVKMDSEEHLVVQGVSANAGNLLARFSHGDDELLKHLKNITNIEQLAESNKILAEIVHLPEARTGNILKRPIIRDYEIPYLAKSSLAKSQQIGIDDLWVSIQNDKIIIKSKKLGKEVLPRLTNAHNYKPRALPMYHFLCDLQFQNKKTYLGFSWPTVVEDHPFLPRVIYKDIILSKAKWSLDRSLIDSFIKSYKSSGDVLKKIAKWRKKFSIPKYILLVEGDNTLLIDLEHIDSVKLLLSSIKNKDNCMLEEFLFDKETVIKRNEEQFTNEFIVTLYNEEKLNAQTK